MHCDCHQAIKLNWNMTLLLAICDQRDVKTMLYSLVVGHSIEGHCCVNHKVDIPD